MQQQTQDQGRNLRKHNFNFGFENTSGNEVGNKSEYYRINNDPLKARKNILAIQHQHQNQPPKGFIDARKSYVEITSKRANNDYTSISKMAQLGL